PSARALMSMPPKATVPPAGGTACEPAGTVVAPFEQVSETMSEAAPPAANVTFTAAAAAVAALAQLTGVESHPALAALWPQPGQVTETETVAALEALMKFAALPLPAFTVAEVGGVGGTVSFRAEVPVIELWLPAGSVTVTVTVRAPSPRPPRFIGPTGSMPP